MFSVNTVVAQNKPVAKPTTAKPAAAVKPQPPKEIAPAVQIYFDFNKSAIKKSEEEKLNKLLEDLKSKKDYKLTLTGHTDSTGNDDYNLQLSQRRVDEVYDWLIEKGMDTSIIARSYFGRAKPREKQEVDEEKKSKNRRVEITIYEKPAPPPPPPPAPKPVRDTCNYDTTVFIGQGISMSINICEFKKLCKKNPAKCLTVDRKSELEEIFESGAPLKTQKGEGFVWGGIFDVKMDSCLKKPASISFKMDPDVYKKAKLAVFKAKGESFLELDKSIKISQSKTKESLKITIPVKCPGTVHLCAISGKSKQAMFKDKTGNIQDIYVVTAEPPTIIPATKKGSSWILNYSSINDAKMYVRLKDGETVVKDIDLNKVRKSKKRGELRKKYKVKAKHLKGL
jgi:outer membrane protein OmpA-like peptidoglycan-associated protein